MTITKKLKHSHDWIMIIKHIPVVEEVRPEYMCIYPSWSKPNKKRFKQQEKQAKMGGWFDPDDNLENINIFPTEFGFEDNRLKDRVVLVNNESVTILAHEYSIVTPENMNLYVNGHDNVEPSHILKPYSIEGEQLLTLLQDSDFKNVYESALVEGATKNQATLLGIGIDIVNNPFPAIGWYQLRSEYKEYFA